jgi:short-subunit dehydrogenase
VNRLLIRFITEAFSGKTVWITGAGTGIGRELAIQLARSGSRVAVSGRKSAELDALAAAHPGISPFPLDVTDEAACRDVCRRIEQELGVPDLVVMCAGIWVLMDAVDYSASEAARVMTVNYQGAVNTAAAALPSMRAKGRGQLCFMGSVAGYRGIPRAALYCASKAALIAHAEALRTDLAHVGIDVSVVNCGFVRTPMVAANDFPMPGIIEADDAARRILAGLATRRFEIAFPLLVVLQTKLMRVLPYWLYFALMRRFVQDGPFGLGKPRY